MSTEHWEESPYSRDSEDRQKDGESTEQQLEQLRNLAKENGYEIVAEYIDETATNSTQ